MKKILSALAAIAMASSVAFADELKINFYNKVFSDDYIMAHHKWDDPTDGKQKETEVDFPGIKEQMYAEIFTDRVDAMVKATMVLDDRDSYDELPNNKSENYYISGEINDWYIEFRPIPAFTLGLHTNIFTEGSLLPIYDDNVWGGNIGSTGFTVTYKPSVMKDALRISVTTPFDTDIGDDDGEKNYINGEKKYGENDDFALGSGVIFVQDYFEIGGAVQDIFDNDERQVSAFVNLPGLFNIIPQMTVGGGLVHSECARVVFDDLIGKSGHFVVDDDEDGIRNSDGCAHGLAYEDLLSSYLKMEFDHFNLTAELLYNFTEENDAGPLNDAPYDFYGAVSIGFKIADFNATATGKILKDFTSGGANLVQFGGFYLDYDVNDRNTVGVGAELDICKDDWHAALPVYWKYHFEK